MEGEDINKQNLLVTLFCLSKCLDFTVNHQKGLYEGKRRERRKQALAKFQNEVFPYLATMYREVLVLVEPSLVVSITCILQIMSMSLWQAEKKKLF